MIVKIIAVVMVMAGPALAHAEDCRAPNVARVVLTYLESVPRLRCPDEGYCRMVSDTTRPRAQPLCLTPEQNAEAER